MGYGYKHDDKIDNKRWEIASTLLNKEDNAEGTFHAIVLFHSPTHFVIEYLRVKIVEPLTKNYTIIDGRRNMIKWIDELKEEDINRRIYPKYRKDDNIKY